MNPPTEKRKHIAAKIRGITRIGCTKPFLIGVKAICAHLLKRYGLRKEPRDVLEPLQILLPLLKAIANAEAEGTGYDVTVQFVPLGQNAGRNVRYLTQSAEPTRLVNSPKQAGLRASSSTSAPMNTDGKQLPLWG